MTDYLVYLCPECKEVTEYHANPAYMHICECGHKTTQDKLIEGIDSGKARLVISQRKEEIARLEELLSELPHAPTLSKRKRK